MGFHSVVMTPPPTHQETSAYSIPDGVTITIEEGNELILTGIVISGELIIDGRLAII